MDNIVTPRRGDIYYVQGSEDQKEQYGNHANRPMLVVSNDHLNACLLSVTMVPLTSKEKQPMPNHVPIYTGLSATALCENVRQVPKNRLGNFLRRCSEEEMEEISQALSYVLDLDKSDYCCACEDVEYNKNPAEISERSDSEETIRLKAELSIYKELYQSLLETIAGAKR